VALALLVVCAYTLDPVQSVDARILVHLAVALESRSYTAAEGVAQLGDPLPLIAMLAAVCAFALALGRRRQALAAVGVVAGANLTTQILKGLLAHPRFQPYVGYHQPWPDAFPSGHATAAASIAVALIIVAPRGVRPLAAAAGVVLTGLVGIAVIALEWHFPSDVLGGILVAAGWGFAAVAALRLSRPRDPAPRTQAASRFAISTK